MSVKKACRLMLAGLALLALALPASANGPGPQFSKPVPVKMLGYNGHIMEPFLTRDGALLFFNNRNDPKDQTDLHVARRNNDLTFRYIGPATGANSAGLDGVASIDRDGNFYFISSRDYDSSGNTLWTGRYGSPGMTDVAPLATNFTPKKLLRLNIDMEVSADGKTLYVAENRWDLLRGVPATSDITMARKTAAGFERLPDADALMANINTKHLEFAPATSADEQTLYFTRLNMKAFRKGKANAFAIMMATRPDRSSPWGEPAVISAISGHTEAPTVTPDGCALYFHRKDGEVFRLYFTQRLGCRVE
jgi:hypothetical protein